MRHDRLEKGFAMPLALLVVLIVGVSSSLAVILSTSTIRAGHALQTSSEAFMAAESGVHLAISEIVSSPKAWIERLPLSRIPLDYKRYYPADISQGASVPVCEGLGCERNLYPHLGGLLKNFGPLAKGGVVVDEQKRITHQLDPMGREPDVVINGISVWYQIERLDQRFTADEAVGLSLSPESVKSQVRFRITASAWKEFRGVGTTATIVSLIGIGLN